MTTVTVRFRPYTRKRVGKVEDEFACKAGGATPDRWFNIALYVQPIRERACPFGSEWV